VPAGGGKRRHLVDKTRHILLTGRNALLANPLRYFTLVLRAALLAKSYERRSKAIAGST
jgi:hypothetical protein